MCPNLAKFLLGPDKIWLKFAIEYLYSFFFLEVENLHQLVRGAGGEEEERTEEEARRFGVTDEMRWFLMSSDPSSMSSV
jgi:hypothetical protein